MASLSPGAAVPFWLVFAVLFCPPPPPPPQQQAPLPQRTFAERAEMVAEVHL